ncbi:hypothetical protein Hypma_005869 [Hypsizygus marmoreus]|uniref:Uncharacterized protein n=1 Tax=Hypsizygus marmoreus TaxID=39966 RepID=A0A369K834_HYPMA|nr:hypothetical protein Hypma_005869 [Hypsizygus marmoreus]
MTTSTRDKHNHGQHTLNRPWIPPLMCPEDVLKGLKNKGEKMDVIQSFAEAFWVGKGQGSGLDWVLRGLLHKSDSDSDPHWTLRRVDESRFPLKPRISIREADIGGMEMEVDTLRTTTRIFSLSGSIKTSNSYFICTSPPTIDKIFARIRSYDPTVSTPSYPRTIAGLTMSVIDLTTGYDSTNPPSYKPSLPLSTGHMIQFRVENKAEGLRIVLTMRTSET